jgi:hypothetical protein
MTDEQTERYYRQILLKEIGLDGQRRLMAAKVLVVSGSDVRRILQRLNWSVIFAIGKKKWVPQTIGTRQPREEGKAEAGNR